MPLSRLQRQLQMVLSIVVILLAHNIIVVTAQGTPDNGKKMAVMPKANGQTAVLNPSPSAPDVYTCENGVCQRNCSLKALLHPEQALFKQPNGNNIANYQQQYSPAHARPKRFALLTFLTTGLFYKYIVAWLIPSLIINDACKNLAIDELIADCFKMTILKRRFSCKLPKPIRNSALFTNDVISIAIKQISDNARKIIDERFKKFADAVRDLPNLHQDFGGESRVSLELLQEAGLISIEPGMIPKPFQKEHKELMDSEQQEHGQEAEEQAKKFGLAEHVGNFISFVQGKTPDQMYKEELQKAIDNELKAMDAREVKGRLAEYAEGLDALYARRKEEQEAIYEKAMEEELRKFREKMVQKKAAMMASYANELAKEKERELNKRESELHRELAERRHREEEEMLQRDREAEAMVEKDDGDGNDGGSDQARKEEQKNGTKSNAEVDNELFGKMIDAEDGGIFGWEMPKQQNTPLDTKHPRRKKRQIVTIIATFIAYNFMRRIALRVAVKNVNIWAYFKNCVRATSENKGWGISCKLPKRFEEEQKFLMDTLKTLMEELTDEGVQQIRLRYALFKRRFPMPVTNGKPMAEHQVLSKFLETIFKGIKILQRHKPAMDAPLEAVEVEVERLYNANPNVVEQ